MIKQFTLSAVGCILLAGTTVSAHQMPVPKDLIPVRPGKEVEKAIPINDKHFRLANIEQRLTKAPQKKGVSTDIIYGVNGDSKIYYKDAAGIYSYGTFLIPYIENNLAANLVFGDDNDVYFRNILSFTQTDTYIKGTIEGDIITVQLPQTIYSWDAEYDEKGNEISPAIDLNLALLQNNTFWDENYQQFFVDYIEAEEQVITYSYNAETGTIELQLPGEPFDGFFDVENMPEFGIGCVYSGEDPYYDGVWRGDIDFTQSFRPFTDEINVLPEELEMEEYTALTGCYNFPGVLVGFDDENVFIKGLSQDVPELVVKADIVTDEYGNTMAFVPQNQITGIYEPYFVYTKAMYWEHVFEDGKKIPYDVFAPQDMGIFLAIDKENHALTNVFPEMYFLLNLSTEEIYYLESFENLGLCQPETFEGVPADAYNLWYSDQYIDFYGYNIFGFRLPAVTAERNPLIVDDLYYRIYLDGEPIEFQQEDLGYAIAYYGIENPTTLLPYSFNNWEDIYQYPASEFLIGIYSEGFETVGVQSVYFYGEETTESNIMTINIATGEITNNNGEAGIEKHAVEGKSEFFDLNGLRINNPENGIFVKRTILSDGSVLVKKVSLR